MADLATERKRLLTTGKRADRTKHDFLCPIFDSAIGQASCLITVRVPSSTDFPVLLLNQPNDNYQFTDCMMSRHRSFSVNKGNNRTVNLHVIKIKHNSALCG